MILVLLRRNNLSKQKKFETRDELNEYFKTLNSGLEARYNLDCGLSIKLYDQTLLEILPPDVNHINHWWLKCIGDLIGEKATVDLLADVMRVMGQLLDQFDQFGAGDF